jgi:hypothetical protein
MTAACAHQKKVIFSPCGRYRSDDISLRTTHVASYNRLVCENIFGRLSVRTRPVTTCPSNNRTHVYAIYKDDNILQRVSAYQLTIYSCAGKRCTNDSNFAEYFKRPTVTVSFTGTRRDRIFPGQLTNMHSQWRAHGGSGVSTDIPQRIGGWQVLCEPVWIFVPFNADRFFSYPNQHTNYVYPRTKASHENK